MQGIHRLASETTLGRVEIGGKADGLLRLMRTGFHVPDGIVLDVGFFAPWIDTVARHPAWAALAVAQAQDVPDLCDALKSVCDTLVLDAERRAGLARALAPFGARNRFAVRSSSPDEDLDGASFAGAYETVLGVEAASVETAVRRCFASALDARIILYKRRMGLRDDLPPIAVIVQQQIASEVAGVAFSINPLTNDHDEAMINANWGQGETVVSGKASPDSFIVSKTTLAVLSRTLGGKESSVWLAASDGVVERPGLRRDTFCLDDDQLATLTRALKRVEEAWNRPVDVEWAFEAGALHLLQARPITTHLPVPAGLATPPGARRRLYWDLTLSIHGIFEPLSPLGAAVIERLIAAIRREMYGGGRLPVAPQGALPVISGGRIYLNLNNFMGLVGETRVLNHLMMLDPLASSALAAVDRARLAPSGVRRLPFLAALAWRMPRRITNTMRGLRRPERARARWEGLWRRHRQILDQLQGKALAPDAFVDAVMAHTLGFILRETLVLYVASRVALGRIAKLFPQPDLETRAQLDALEQALPGNLTIEMGLALHALAPLVAPEETAALPERLMSGMVSPTLLSGWQDFLASYGHRGPKEIDLAAPRFREAPHLLLHELASACAAPPGATSPSERFQLGQVARRHAQAALAARLSGRPRLVQRFDALCAAVETLGGFRESHKYVAVEAIDRIRSYMLDLARTWAALKRIDTIEDIFFLDLPQVTAAADDPRLDLRPLVARGRDVTDAASRCKSLSPLMDSRGRFHRPPRPTSARPGEVPGHAVSTGVAIGRVKVLNTPSEKPLLPGEVLVARATDPGWTPLFVNAAAIILEVGGALQHGALVAREYGKPCVSGVQNATHLFVDGEEVEVNGDLGVVRRLTLDALEETA